MAEEFKNVFEETELDINDASQIHFWIQRWNVSECDLRKAVADVGSELAELRIALGR